MLCAFTVRTGSSLAYTIPCQLSSSDLCITVLQSSGLNIAGFLGRKDNFFILAPLVS